MLHRSVLNLLISVLPATRFFILKRKLCKWANINLGSNTSLCGGVKFYGNGNINIGDNCWIGIGVKFFISVDSNLTINNNVDIAPQVIFHSGTHDIGLNVRRAGKSKSNDINIGAGTWIGVRSIILAGVFIPPGCIVGAGSTVTEKKYPHNSLIAGSPAIVKRILN